MHSLTGFPGSHPKGTGLIRYVGYISIQEWLIYFAIGTFIGYSARLNFQVLQQSLANDSLVKLLGFARGSRFSYIETAYKQSARLQNSYYFFAHKLKIIDVINCIEREHDIHKG